jgi:hypothetical protein
MESMKNGMECDPGAAEQVVSLIVALVRALRKEVTRPVNL